ncbi:hypothetical protein DFP72DRAFT_937659 [Ephemerocybe angulata]|uniref:DUF6533 domain-containing protein n=1 Tax=Ephemerocybe angulata TaxID=980116 RepID=A0A8H6LUH4_9AGAR|nr:hypothetical protein DFP72DRAFT_937659 [Tulosesus angulatus]
MAEQFSLLVSAIRVNQNQGYCKVAVMTLLAYDVIHNFSEEVKYIWKSKWSFSKAMYLVVRYYGVVLAFAMLAAGERHDPTAKVRAFCHRYIRIFALLGDGYFVIIDIICVMRIYALYERSIKVLVPLSALSMVETGIGFYAGWQSTQFEGAPDVPKNELSTKYGCGFILAPNTGNRSLYIASLSVTMLLNFSFFLASVLKLRMYVKDESGMVDYRRWWSRSYASPMMKAFMKDGAVSFLQIATVHTLGGALVLYRDGFYYTPAWPWQYAVNSYVGCRLLLNLRRANRTPGSSGKGASLPMRFATREAHASNEMTSNGGRDDSA